MQPSTTIAHDMPAVAAALEEATAMLTAASRQVQAARAEETRWINILNEAQKRFDELVEDMRKAAPQQSDWHSRRAVRGAIIAPPPPMPGRS